MKIEKIAITAGKDGKESAFDPELLEVFGVDEAVLIETLAEALRPFAMLLREDCGIALYCGLSKTRSEPSNKVIGLKVTSYNE